LRRNNIDAIDNDMLEVTPISTSTKRLEDYQHHPVIQQENLADAKVSAQQQFVTENQRYAISY